MNLPIKTNRSLRLIQLVVPVPPVPDHVHDDVFLKLLPVVHGDSKNLADDLRLVAVHVDNRRANCLRDLGAVEPGPRLRGAGGEPDLVVDHDVDDALRGVALEVLHLQVLVHDALPRERGVAVQQNAHSPSVNTENLLVALLVVEEVLDGAGFPVHERVHGLQVRGVRQHRQADLFAVRVLLVAGRPQVVLHV